MLGVNTRRANQFDKEIKIAKTMMLIIGSFLICWLPYTIRLSMELISDEKNVIEHTLFDLFGKDGKFVGKILRTATHHITLLNAFFDPLIYFFRMKEIREAVKTLLCWRAVIEPTNGTTTGFSRTSVLFPLSTLKGP